MRQRVGTLILIVVLALVVSACSGSDGDEPTKVGQPASGTLISDIGDKQVTTTLIPTWTPVPVVETATPTVIPTPMATPVVLDTFESFGDDRCLFTGEVISDTALLDRRPIAIKINNSPAEYTRPQSGISQADIVFEHTTEGPITRFTAIFYCQTPEKVGPIRSARLIDLELPVMYDTALVYSGASNGVTNKLHYSDFSARLIGTYEDGYYRTGEDKPWEHTLYGEPELFWQVLERKELNKRPELSKPMAFNNETPVGNVPAISTTIEYLDWTTVQWIYDEESGRYSRWADGEIHVDANSDEQITAANVVLLFVPHQIDGSICEFQGADKCLAFATETQIWGQGPVAVLRDGVMLDGFWQRANREDPLTFIRGDGSPLPLQIGNSWIQVIPTHYDEAVTIDG